ncbi:hypothetical protein [Nonomuraea turcica]|uniref:hypothetical protein n=1 Tax=Nonomuraea sp. G32 TaxID=3067274 RepID=UPI00273CCC0F|nr:hypothetical protein [Nonomuraea sp. G32]MDP4509297.1 hypothetical protein [Nonomuraea sp. G32]
MTTKVLESHRDDAAQTSPTVSAVVDQLISEFDTAASVFVTTGPQVLAVACRVLGEAIEAEDRRAA